MITVCSQNDKYRSAQKLLLGHPEALHKHNAEVGGAYVPLLMWKYFMSYHPGVDFRSSKVFALFDALDSGLDDYTTDERGDVGSWIRIACIRALSSVIEDLFSISGSLPDFSSFLPPHRYHAAIGRILRQGVERLDNVRQISGECFMHILKLPLPATEHAERWGIKNIDLMKALFSV